MTNGKERTDVYENNTSGILLTFDDYSPQNWEEYFDLFDEYGAKATSFINTDSPTDFCANAIARGHEMGFHTVSHMNLTKISEEEILAQAIEPIEIFAEQGYALISFAYPYGSYTEEFNELLLQHYTVVRGALAIRHHSNNTYRQ